MLGMTDYNKLADIVQNTWGKGNADHTGSNFISLNVKFLNQEEDCAYLQMRYNSIISFGDLDDRHQQFDYAERDADSAFSACIKKIKDEMKEEVGKTLKVSIEDEDANFSHLTMGQYSGRSEINFFKTILVKIS